MKKHLLSIILIIAILFVCNQAAPTYAEALETPAEEPEIEEIIEHDHVIIHYLNPTSITHEVWEQEVLINTTTGKFIVTENWALLRTESQRFILVNNVPVGDQTEVYEYYRICSLCGYMENDGY